MSDVLGPVDAARAALEVAAGGTAAAVVAAIGHSASAAGVRRMIVYGDGVTNGTLGYAPLDETAVRLGRAALRGDGSTSVETITLGGATWLLYVETHRPPEQLVIVGAGHIAVPLAHMAGLLGFRVTVLDDREEFATTERFDDDVVVQQADFARDPFAGVRLADDTYIALVTRGHRWDFDCLQRIVALDARPRYIGMIGSRRRVRAAFRALLEAGVPREVLASIRAPIGVEIQAETPVEIAVSIAAEMVAVRRGADAGSISRRERVLDRFLNEE